MDEPLVFSGEMWFLYLDVADGGSWNAAIPRFVFRGGEFSFQFRGTDQDFGPYSGSGSAKKMHGEQFIGQGEFVLQGEPPLTSTICCTVAIDMGRKSCIVEGTWEEARGRYGLEFDLRLVQQPGIDTDTTDSGRLQNQNESSAKKDRLSKQTGERVPSRKAKPAKKQAKSVRNKKAQPRSNR